jgi:hypothetical protein
MGVCSAADFRARASRSARKSFRLGSRLSPTKAESLLHAAYRRGPNRGPCFQDVVLNNVGVANATWTTQKIADA